MAYNSPKRMGDVWALWARSCGNFGIDTYKRLKFRIPAARINREESCTMICDP